MLGVDAVVLMVAILDPPREEAVEAIKIAHRAGITVKMITGAVNPTLIVYLFPVHALLTTSTAMYCMSFLVALP